MTDQSPNAQATPPVPAAPALPPMVAGLVDRAAHLLAGALVALLISHGLLQKTQSAEFVDIAVSVLVGVASFGFAWLQTKLARKTVAAAINAPAPTIPVKP